MDKLFTSSPKIIIRKLVNQRENIFNSMYNENYDELVKVFLKIMQSDLAEDLIEDLKYFIEDGICDLARNFSEGKQISPVTMNILIHAILVFNNKSPLPFNFRMDKICAHVNVHGLIFLSNVLIKIVNNPILFELNRDPWVWITVEHPKRPKKVSVVKSSKRSPRIFIIHAHGVLPVIEGDEEEPYLPVFETPVMGSTFGPGTEMVIASSLDYRLRKVITVKSEVDTFTSAKFGKALWMTMTDDPPQLLFLNKLFELLDKHEHKSKDELRDTIMQALCLTREEHIPEQNRDTCRFRCHIVGEKIADINLFEEGAATVEDIISIDTNTGNIEQILQEFGLVDKEKIGKAIQEFEKIDQFKLSPGAIKQFEEAIVKAKSDLSELKANPAEFKTKDYKIYATEERIKNMDTSARNMDRFSKYEYSEELKHKYGNKIRLSHLIQIGIERQIIDPNNDFVVVLSCRVAERKLPIGTMSPRDLSGSESNGGARKLRNKLSKKKISRKKNRKLSRRHKNIYL